MGTWLFRDPLCWQLPCCLLCIRQPIRFGGVKMPLKASESNPFSGGRKCFAYSLLDLPCCSSAPQQLRRFGLVVTAMDWWVLNIPSTHRLASFVKEWCHHITISDGIYLPMTSSHSWHDCFLAAIVSGSSRKHGAWKEHSAMHSALHLILCPL